MQFINIDNMYKKGRQETIGEIQPKYWFWNANENVLVKRQHSAKVIGQNKKSKMFNHFGEYFAYLLYTKSGVRACKVDIITLHDLKNKYAKTKNLYTACASHSQKKLGQYIYAGEVIIDRFKYQNREEFQETLNENIDLQNIKRCNISVNEYTDNIDIIIASIINETKKYEQACEKRSKEQIEQDIKDNLNDLVQMITADCIFGNSDRHSQNWSMLYDPDLGQVRIYDCYDNEAILGFRKTEAEIKRVTEDINTLKKYSEEELFSRMGIGPINSGVSYKNMLEYLIKKFPEYTISAIKRITKNVTVEDIENLYIEARGITKRSQDKEELTQEDELPDEYRIFGINLFSERSLFAKNLVRQYEEKQNSNITLEERF